MAAEWLFAAIFLAIATPTMGHFEAGVKPLWVRVVRWLAYLAVAGILGLTVGRPWTWLWLIGLPLVGTIFHVTWCLRHGINPITAEPRDKYLALRGK
jgi:hypothetical protein